MATKPPTSLEHVYRNCQNYMMKRRPGIVSIICSSFACLVVEAMCSWSKTLAMTATPIMANHPEWAMWTVNCSHSQWYPIIGCHKKRTTWNDVRSIRLPTYLHTLSSPCLPRNIRSSGPFIPRRLASTARDISSRADGMQAQTKDCPSARTSASSGAMTVVLPSPMILGSVERPGDPGPGPKRLSKACSG